MLTDRDREILAFERLRWKYAGAKATHVLETFGLSMTRYYQVVNALLDRPEAMEYDALLVKRLRRLRDQRRASRLGTGRTA